MSKQYTEANKSGIHRDHALSRALERQGLLDYFSVIPITPGAIVSGRNAVAAAGTAETLVAVSTPCLWVDVSADTGNTDLVVVGDVNVDATPGSQVGNPIIPGNPPFRIYIDDVQKLYVDSITNNDAVVFTYATP